MSSRRLFIIGVIASLAMPWSSGVAQQRVAPRTLVLMHANLIDGVRGAFANDATVIVREGIIADIVTGPFTPPADAQVIDVRGRFVLPGLVDSHTHISSFANARRALESGVTTIRSASVPAFQDVALREAVKKGVIAGPDVRAAGVFVSPELGETMLADPRLATFKDGVTSEAALREVVTSPCTISLSLAATTTTPSSGFAGNTCFPASVRPCDARTVWVYISPPAATRAMVPNRCRGSGEVAFFVELGMTPLEAIRSATTVSAELLGLADRIGVLKPGYEADLIVVESNPLQDIRSLADVLIVISNGVVALNRTPFQKAGS